MLKKIRVNMSITKDSQIKLNKCLRNLNLKSSGQLIEMLISGDEKRIEWIMEEFKRINDLF